MGCGKEDTAISQGSVFGCCGHVGGTTYAFAKKKR